MTNTTDLIPFGPCQERGCGLGRAAGVHSGQEDDYHGYSPPIRTSPAAEAAIKGLVEAARVVRDECSIDFTGPLYALDNLWAALAALTGEGQA